MRVFSYYSLLIKKICDLKKREIRTKIYYYIILIHVNLSFHTGFLFEGNEIIISFVIDFFFIISHIFLLLNI